MVGWDSKNNYWYTVDVANHQIMFKSDTAFTAGGIRKEVQGIQG